MGWLRNRSGKSSGHLTITPHNTAKTLQTTLPGSADAEKLGLAKGLCKKFQSASWSKAFEAVQNEVVYLTA